MAASDRRCRAWSLDNPLRRRLAPASRELDLLGVEPGQTVADLGAGVGFFVEGLLRRVGPEGGLFAVEPDPESLAHARSRVRDDPRVRFLEGSAACVPQIPDRSVDRVVLSLVLCCMVDKDGALNEAWRILRPGGRVYASNPRVSFKLPRRRPSLRVTSERWAALVRAHLWQVIPVRSSWAVTRHLLARPLEPLQDPTAPDGPPGVRREVE